MNVSKWKNIAFQKRDNCMVCGTKMDAPVIELPDFPMTELYTNEKVEEKAGFLDQSFHFCSHCGHGQIAHVIDIELQYNSSDSYNFRTSQSATGRESSDFFADFVTSVAGDRHFSSIVEIGCNDLYLLKSLKDKADRLTGIDPILQGREEEFSESKVTAIGDFFENVELEDDLDLVLCKDALEHVSDPKQMVRKIVDRATDDTTFFFQFPMLETLLTGCRFDQIFHQHLNYFSLKSIIYMLDELGCELLSYKINKNHWGAILVAFRKGEDNSRFADDVWDIKPSDILDRYAVFKSNMESANRRMSFLNGTPVYGYGAALMLPVLAYHLGNDFSRFKFIIDDDKTKEGLYYMNLPVSIRSMEHVTDIENSVILITAISAMNNVRRILTKLVTLNPEQIILPLNTI